MNKNSRIYVAGHTGLAGSAIVRELERKGYDKITFYLHEQLDLKKKKRVFELFAGHDFEYVFLAAAHAGGIKEAIENPVGMISDNLRIQTNVINACNYFGIKKLIFLGSSCMYPVDGKQPYTEEQLGTGKTDENWSYAVAKLAGVELCRAYHRQYGCDFMTVMPCNLYGVNDKFGENAHVIPSLIGKFHEQDSVKIWGHPETKREFLYSDDLAKACVMLMEGYTYDDLFDGVINVGSGEEVSIADLVETVKDIVNPESVYAFDCKSDKAGVPSKLMDSSRMLKLGWKPETHLNVGIAEVYEWYKNRTFSESGKRAASV